MVQRRILARRSSDVKDQLPTQKVGNRSGIAGKARASNAQQRPARRDRESNVSWGGRARHLLGYVPAALKISLTLLIAGLVFMYKADERVTPATE